MQRISEQTAAESTTRVGALKAPLGAAMAGVVAAMVLVALLGGVPAAADSIYLKNGRVIRSAEARVEDGRVRFTQFGSEQSIPLSIVERVVDDDRVGPGESRVLPAGAADGAVETAGSGSAAVLDGSSSSAATGVPGLGDLAGSELATQLRALLGADGRIDPQRAAGALQALGSGGLLPLAEQLGSLAAAGAGDSNAAGVDLSKLDRIVPVVRRLGELLATPDPSPEETMATVQQLLQDLGELGVTSDMIREYARQLGIPLGGLLLPR